ncbi:hypothetical protein O2V63_12650 [Modestobacter sp. VKM Ac-2977]|uniref:hypothetical protein n=1 Tax=Modestobacter sp. VKM Ac-2977 TaxID=3004131 RepID=UPI0022AAD988|nr:hypothetical protein [Modestobacter sp. VKM Ac-2977]MCZ2821185.1 hypothetical protein [Modestobacter sp. VKM Ac-2977]
MRSLAKLFIAALLAMTVLVSTPSLANAAPSTAATEGTIAITASAVPAPQGVTPGGPGGQVSVQGVCLANWLTVYGCVTAAVQAGRTVWKFLSSGRTCTAYRIEYLINSMNGSVAGTRKICTKYK